MCCSISPRRPRSSPVIAGSSARRTCSTSVEALAARSSSRSRSARLAVGRGAQQGNPLGMLREAGLSHRPLSRQGDGAEHPGASLRQRHLRADVEPQSHRPRADHGGRNGRRRRRGKYYDATGALRDMVPNHLFQLLDIDRDGAADSLRRRCRARRKGQGAARPSHRFGAEGRRAQAVRGQYGARHGRTANRCCPIAEAPEVAPDSTTETYVALKLTMDNWRWAGVPFYLRTGKALGARRSEIVIQFKQAPLALFRDTPVERLTPERSGAAHPARRRRHAGASASRCRARK